MEQQILETPIKLTETAAEEIKRLMSEPNFDSSLQLRIGVKGGGCSGLSYVIGFDKKENDDESFIVNDIPCIMKKAHSIYLMGISIDWQNGLNNRGFVFTNPNASSTCGCGSSFSV